ncbi:MAG: ATP-binding protein [Terriglobales bacterium]
MEPKLRKLGPGAGLKSRSAPVIERAPLPIVELHGRMHVVSYANSAFCALLGKSRAELLGKTFAEIVPNAGECVPLLDKVYQTGMGLTHAQRDDSKTDSASWLYSMWPALDPSERPVGVIIQMARVDNFHQNVTAINEALLIAGLRQQEATEAADKLNQQLQEEIAERQRAEAGVLESEQRFRALVLATSDAVYRMSPDWSQMLELHGRDFLANRESPSRTWLQEYIHPDDHLAVMAVVDRAIRTKSIFELEHRIRRVDGTLGWTFSRAIPLLGAKGKIVEWFGAASDVTGRKEAEAALRDQDRRMRMAEKMAAAGQLAASMSHEINNPLTSVTNVLYLLATSAALDAPARSLVTTATAELSRISRIVHHSLSYHQRGATAKDFDLGELVMDSIQIFQGKLKNVRLTQKVEKGLSALGFSGEIRQVIDNLLLNALDAMPDGGCLGIAASKSFDWKNHDRKGVRLTIADSGCGIPKDIRARIFEPFFTTKAEKGTGLGLWVLQGIIAKHEGVIRVRSSDIKGKSGTVISVFLPAQTLRTR